MPRKKPPKPANRAHLCWSWLKGRKATGEAAEKRGDTATAERCRCHRPAGGTNGRCHLHGGTVPRGPRHPRYTTGKYSQAYSGIFSQLSQRVEAVEAHATLREEVAISAALIEHEMVAFARAVPPVECWAMVRQMTRAFQRHREAGDNQAMAKLLTERDAFILETRPASSRELTRLLETHRKIVDTEEKRKDRADDHVKASAVFGIVEAMALAVKTHVSSADEREAVGKAFTTILEQADYPDLRERNEAPRPQPPPSASKPAPIDRPGVVDGP